MAEEMDLGSKVQDLEALVANLQAQNETLRKDNGTLKLRLAEFENNFEQKVNCEETLESTVHNEGAPQQVESGILDKAVPVKKKKKRIKKKNATARSMPNYCTRHIALKVMYLGSRYQGFASQATSPITVEAELFGALERTKLISGSAAEAKYTRCGRTDKGVSATGQVIALYVRSKRRQEDPDLTEGESEVSKSINEAIQHDGDRVAMARASRSEEELYARSASTEDELDYVGMLNRSLPEDIRVLGWCPVPPGFNARWGYCRFSCFNREYKYFFIGNGLDIDAMKVACKKFEGEHDFTNFCKMDAANVHNYMRTVSNFDILPCNEEWGGKSVWIMKVKGTAFLWHQVRCMAAVLFMVGQGHESPTIVEEMLDVKNYVRKPQYIMAPETPLLLFQCGYQGLSFHAHPDAVKHLRVHLEALLQTSIVNSSLLLQGLLELPPADKSAKTRNPLSRKGKHILLRNRLTQPTYEERRRSQHVDPSDSLNRLALDCED